MNPRLALRFLLLDTWTEYARATVELAIRTSVAIYGNTATNLAVAAFQAGNLCPRMPQFSILMSIAFMHS
jgi:hypothetical protein